MNALGDQRSENVRAAAATALGHGLEKGGEYRKDGLKALVNALGDPESWKVRAAAATALGHAVGERRRHR